MICTTLFYKTHKDTGCQLKSCWHDRNSIELIRNSRFKTFHHQIRLKMMYVLAKTTSSNEDVPFNAGEVEAQWKEFNIRTAGLKYLSRIEANTTRLFPRALDLQGGLPEVRDQILNPIITMPYTPPMSFLNKLFSASEYLFLSVQGSSELITAMLKHQKTMMKNMEKASSLYKQYPQQMLDAVRFIKTETVPEKDKKYVPEKQDVDLLSHFVLAATLLTDQASNQYTGDDIKLNPSHVLLPLLTVFHLEYADQTDITKLITSYNGNMKVLLSEEKKYLAYGLSLFTYVQEKEKTKLMNCDLISLIQNALTEYIKSEGTKGNMITNSSIRAWVNTNYGTYFSENTLLNIQDNVNISASLKKNNCPGIIAEKAPMIAAHFSQGNENEEYENLVSKLANLANRLPLPAQQKQFLEYCLGQFRAGQLFSRTHQNTPPSFMNQFMSLLDVINSDNFFQFQRYMAITEEYAGNSDNSLAKACYFLNTLYPKLQKDETTASPTELFNLAAKLTCQAPLTLLRTAELTKQAENAQQDLITAIDAFIKIENPTIEHVKSLQSALLNDSTAVKEANDLINQVILSSQRKLTLVNRIKRDIGKTITKVTHTDKISRLKETLNTLKSELSKTEITQSSNGSSSELSLEDIILHTYQKKQELTQKYSTISARIDQFFSSVLKTLPNLFQNTNTLIDCLTDNLILLDDTNTALSLMYHDDNNMTALMQIFLYENYEALSNENLKKAVIKAIVAQLNNNITLELNEITTFIDHIQSMATQNEPILDYLNRFYQQVPFPSLTTFVAWTKSPINAKNIQSAYDIFNKNPSAVIITEHGSYTAEGNGRNKENGFYFVDALAIVRKIEGGNPKMDSDYLYLVAAEQDAARQKSSEDILTFLKTFKNQQHVNYPALIMHAIEFLYRSKSTTNKPFELNTTQILAILAMFETGKKITGEIATGEGKSRIMMVINACQYLLGNTVDFITSDIALAERDYLAALPFFTALGAEVTFIRASSEAKDYKKGGINVSDLANLCQFRAKAAGQGNSQLVLDDPKKRVATIDEQDAVCFDNKKVYGYAATISQESVDLLPIYPLLMDYLAKGYDHSKLEQFKSYLLEKDPAFHANVVQKLSDDRLTSLLLAAQKAKNLSSKFGNKVDGYDIAINTTVSTPLGDKTVSAALCYAGNTRADKYAVFSDGVHQCLHAELNRLMKNTANVSDPHLKAVLEIGSEKARTFEILPEVTASNSLSIHSMLDVYQEGAIFGVTGTTGSTREKEELTSRFETTCISIPKHKPMRRADHPAELLKDKNEQIASLIQHIKEAQENNQPVLIICNDDREAYELTHALESHLTQEGSTPTLNRIFSTLNNNDSNNTEEALIQSAGKKQSLLIATDMVGRGTDISLIDQAKEKGLKVLLTYLPKTNRDQRQIQGRAGRQGDEGDTHLVLNLEQLKENYKSYGIESMLTEPEFYLSPNSFLAELQARATHHEQLHRLLAVTMDDFLNEYKKIYYGIESKSEAVQTAWATFLTQANESQKKAQNTIDPILDQLDPSSANITMARTAIQTHYNAVTKAAADALKPIADNNVFPDKINISPMLETWFTAIEKQTTPVSIKKAHEVKPISFTPAWDHCAGKAYLYDYKAIAKASKRSTFMTWLKPTGRQWFANCKAWKQGKGQLLATWKAWRKGFISSKNLLSQYFPYLVKPVEEIRYVEASVPATYSLLHSSNQSLFKTTSNSRTASLTNQPQSAESATEKRFLR